MIIPHPLSKAKLQESKSKKPIIDDVNGRSIIYDKKLEDIQEILIDHNKDRFVVRYTSHGSTDEFTFDSKAEAEDDIESWTNPSHGALDPGDCATLYELIKIKQTYMA